MSFHGSALDSLLYVEKQSALNVLQETIAVQLGIIFWKEVIILEKEPLIICLFKQLGAQISFSNQRIAQKISQNNSCTAFLRHYLILDKQT